MSDSDMHATDPDLLAACQALLTAHGAAPAGPVPLLVDYTREDREAKGLRKLAPRASALPPVPDTVLEAAAHAPLLLLSGPSGCGKRTSLLDLALTLAGACVAGAGAPAAMAREVVRNESGERVAERWTGPAAAPLLVHAVGPATLVDLLGTAGPAGERLARRSLHDPVLLLIDGAERLGQGGGPLLDDAVRLVGALPNLRIVVAADSDAVRAWAVPPAFARRRIVDLIEPQRLALAARLRSGPSPADWRSAGADLLGHAGHFTLALEVGAPFPATPAAAVDRWLAAAARRAARPVADLVAWGAAAFDAQGAIPAPASLDPGDQRVLARPFIRRALAARHLATLTAAEVAALQAADPLKWSGPVVVAAELCGHGGAEAIVAALVGASGTEDVRNHATLTAAAILARLPASPAEGPVRARLHRIVEQGRLPTALREQAGRALSRAGDPRDLEALVPVPAGAFTMGSLAHPNSAPPHTVVLAQPCRIGRYPVTNRLYRAFAEATGRPWRSRDGTAVERQNAPAVDLTWHDARACCDWLTARWRAEGRIAADDRVRLPTEAEWERAARGVRGGDGAPVFPWPGDWRADHANSEEAGFNDTCSVGLFPLGRSADGCDDMAGQVWEWTSTLWGDDMATPHFRYPYRADDGREDPAAPPEIRRVLRGACFLSPQEKANCTYRGSLEPHGYWRGNGFRVVVAAG